MTTRQRITTTSPDDTAARLRALRDLVPEAFRDGTIDADALAAVVGLPVTGGRAERFGFTWSGKRDSIQIAGLPTRAALVPALDDSIDWVNTDHAIIEGDNLEVLKLLGAAYFGRVKMIYIDPPYNTGSDFVYPDDYADPLEAYLRMTGQSDADGNRLTSRAERGGRVHSAWLSMLYPRLVLARQLLRDDGVIFVSIDDHEVHHLRVIMDEVFGEENFVATVIWQKVYAPKSSAKHFSEDHEYVLVYARNGALWASGLLARTSEQDEIYKNPDNDPRGEWRANNLAARNYYSKGTYSITCPSGRIISGPPKGSYWRVSEEKFWELDRDGRIWWGKDGNNVPAPKIFLTEVKKGRVPQTLWTYKDVGHTQDAKKDLLSLIDFETSEDVFETPKPVQLIKRMLEITTDADEGDIVLDFFAGSGTTAQAVLELNQEDGGSRRFILVQLPEPTSSPAFPSIAHITRERVRRVIQRIHDGQQGAMFSTPADLGFRAYTLAPSHFRQWQPVEADAAIDQMAFLAASPMMPGWTANGVIAEVALKEGFGLNMAVEPIDRVPGTRAYRVSDPDMGQVFHICLDDALPANLPLLLGLTPEDSFICLDSALDDTKAANFALQSRLRTI